MKTLFQGGAGRMRRQVAVVLLFLALAVKAQAQNFDQIAPKLPAKDTSGKVINEAGEKAMSGHADNEVLVPHLKGIVMLSEANQVQPDGVSSGQPIVPG